MVSDSEDTPLLASTTHEAIYDRFAPGQKKWIVFVASFAGLLPMFAHATFVPSIPQIAKDLDSTYAVVSLTVSLSVLGSATGAWMPIDVYVGRALFIRRELWCRDGSFVEDFVVLAIRANVWMFWCLALGAGVIGDIYKLEERGTAIGVFFGATLLGFAVAPLLGGIAAQYWSWRNLHYSLAAWGLLELLLIYVSFPETSHPGTLGIDKITRKRWIHITWVNPLSSLWLLRSPNIFAVMLASTLMLFTDYVLLVPLAHTIGIRYGITNEAIIGACFLPNGLGNVIGAPVAGRLSDIVVRKWREKRKGVWSPEDRLRATWIGGLVMVPLSTGASGLITTYVGGPVGLCLNLLCLFMNGFGVDFVFNPIGSYNVDVARSRSAETTAASSAIRSLIIAAATSLVIPSIDNIGVAWTNIIAAILAVIGQGLILLTIRYGDRMRASVDVGFSITENNS
ncbi:major facilitator superfamily domain-containing protein [Suillus spraguei]|nr:major facilitator superfamily domain-containing protein [Suillus spraguei]